MLQAAALGLDVGGKIIGGIAGARQAKEDAKQRARELAMQQQNFAANLGENQRQFNAQYGQKAFDQNLNANTAYGDRAQAVNRELETLPMRDKAQALLLQRMGAPAQQTTARSFSGGAGTDALRGGALPQMPYDLNAFKAQAEAYKPGDGGMSGDVQRQLLARYMNVPTAPSATDLPQGQDLAAIEAQVAQALRQWESQGVKVGDRERMSNELRQRLLSGGK